jgi:hypothetical protein
MYNENVTKHYIRPWTYRVPRIIFGPKGDELTRERRRLHKEEVYMVCMSTGREFRGFWFGDLRERNYLKNLGVYRRIILKWAFKQWNGKTKIGLLLLRIVTGGECLGKLYANLWVP